MSIICPYDGHIIKHPMGDFCADHGVKWFVQCSECSAPWRTKTSDRYALTSISLQNQRQTASDYCAGCGMPGPWLTRPQLIEWLQTKIKASPDIPATERLELVELLSKLKDAKADDARTVAAWQKIRDSAPKVWKMAKPVIDVLVADEVKKLLGL